MAIGSLATTTSTATAATSQEIPITNPAFIQPRVDPNNLATYDQNNNAIVGWRVISGNVDVYGTKLARLGTDFQAVDLNGNKRGGIEQAIPIATLNPAPAAVVTIGFQARNNDHPNCPKDVEQKFHVQFADNPGGRVSFNLFTVNEPGPYADWQPLEAQITSPAGVKMLQFVSDNDGYCSGLITKITAVETQS
ncbi:hypothetical protein AB0O91_00925 [Kitasatospora sp. NPDC089797]|uniref:hypothetical protein n=1 Tax=Kitasatospora sp. NPDC089797 TaxID=3155298 RepID=UPI0034394DB5